jgi:mono/diheme cytochrome c family protein
MKKILQFLKWTGLIILSILITVSILTAARQNLKFDAPYPEIRASGDTAVIAKGKHLVNAIAHCMDCHSLANSDSLLNLDKDVPLSGSVAFKLPVGTIYSANITSDPVYGIGKYDDGQIARVLRYGVHPDGTAVYDFMPFHNLSDEDLTAVISYLRTQKPIPLKKQENELNAIGSMVKAFMVKPVGPSEIIEQRVQKDSSAEYGKYLVMSVANCSGCHTKRSISGEFTGDLLAGGNPMGGGHIPPNLTPDSTSRIFGWTEQMFMNRFRTGKVYPDSEMPWNSFKRMDDIELKAIYKFLQTIRPVKTSNSKS